MKISRLIVFSSLFLLAIFSGCKQQENLIDIKIVTVTDLHAAIFPFDYINNRPQSGSLAHVSSYVNQLRADTGQHVILLDNGDLLQGQPAGYFFNFEFVESPLLFAQVMNFLQFDAATLGNHDIEMGPDIYWQLNEEFDFPWLAANITRGELEKPAFEPYTIIEKEGVRIAILGLITPSVPNWLPRKLWDGLVFEDMYLSAKYWMDYITKNEKPHYVVGLFHSGAGPEDDEAAYDPENTAWYIARNVPEFDVVFTGHDHRVRNTTVTNIDDKEVILIAGQSHGRSVATIDLQFEKRGRRIVLRSEAADIVSMEGFEPDPNFMERFGNHALKLEEFVNQPLAELKTRLSSRQAYTGNSAFVDFIHQVHFQLTDAEISLAAPLSFDAVLETGEITMRDMFRLYPYENYLYVMELTGQEVKDFLEFSKGLWFNTMESAQDNIFLFRRDNEGKVIMEGNRTRFQHPFFNFDSAAGINYTVDVTQPAGSRIKITGLSNGKPFVAEQIYRVAINSYRGSGGGGHLTVGAGIDHSMLEDRIVWVSENDLRTHLASYIKEQGSVNPVKGNNWTVEPRSWTQRAFESDLKLLFGN